jgi:hypothetical protein
MKKFTTLFVVLALATSLMACSMVKKFTGQQDDTVLPGTREEILPPDQQTARDPSVTGKKPVPCNSNDINCVSPPVDQESKTAQ